MSFMIAFFLGGASRHAPRLGSDNLAIDAGQQGEEIGGRLHSLVLRRLAAVAPDGVSGHVRDVHVLLNLQVGVERGRRGVEGAALRGPGAAVRLAVSRLYSHETVPELCRR